VITYEVLQHAPANRPNYRHALCNDNDTLEAVHHSSPNFTTGFRPLQSRLLVKPSFMFTDVVFEMVGQLVFDKGM
jgi:hypothetical protein